MCEGGPSHNILNLYCIIVYHYKYCMVNSRRGHGFHVHTDADNVLCACYCCTGNCFTDNYSGRERVGN